MDRRNTAILAGPSLESLCLTLANEISSVENTSNNSPTFSGNDSNSNERIKNLRQKIHFLAAESRRVGKQRMVVAKGSQNQVISRNSPLSIQNFQDYAPFYAMMARKIRDEVFRQVNDLEKRKIDEKSELDHFHEEELQWRNDQSREIIGEFREREAEAKANLFEAGVEISNQSLLIDDLDFRMRNDEKLKNRLEEEIRHLRENLRQLLKEKAEFEEDRRKIEAIKNDFQLQKEINELIWSDFLRLEEERDFLRDSLSKSLEKLQELNLEKIENFEETLRKVELDFS